MKTVGRRSGIEGPDRRWTNNIVATAAAAAVRPVDFDCVGFHANVWRCSRWSFWSRHLLNFYCCTSRNGEGFLADEDGCGWTL